MFLENFFAKFYLISTKFYQLLLSVTSSGSKFYQIPPMHASIAHCICTFPWQWGHLYQHNTKACIIFWANFLQTIYFSAKMKLHELPVDVLRCISDFSGTAACSHVCAQMWYHLQQRHLRYYIRHENALPQIMDTLCMQALRTASLRFRGNGDKGAQALAGLKTAPALHTLHLDLGDNHVGDNGAQALAGLKEAPALHTLDLNLEDNNVGDNGAQALAGLKIAPALHTLDFHLGHNHVGDNGAQALAGLKSAPALHTLHLDLGHNHVGDNGAQALAGLKIALRCTHCIWILGETMWETMVRKPLQG